MEDLQYFNVEVDGRIHPIPKGIYPTDHAKGKQGYHITIWNSTIEASRKLMVDHNIEHISVSCDDLDFLSDPVFSDIKGIVIHHDVPDLSPLYKLKQLKFLYFADREKEQLDFNYFPDLVEFRGVARKCINIEKLVNLKYLELNYFKEKNLEKLLPLSQLEELTLYNADCKNLKGLGNCTKLKKITLEDCKNLISLEGLSDKNSSLSGIEIRNCLSFSDTEVIEKLPQKIHITINGQQLEQYEKIKLERNINFDHWVDSQKNKSQIRQIELVLQNLQSELTPKNWKQKLAICILKINEIDSLNYIIYTGEREDLLRCIQQICIEYDTLEVDVIMGRFREW